MGIFETTSITVAQGKRCQDRVKILEFPEGVILVVADGAGGCGAGEQAADEVIREISTEAKLEHDESAWCRLLRQIDMRIPEGESTCVVVACSEQGIVGATVGDSQAWLVSDGELHDLTCNRVRKPLLGSGDAVPVGFSRSSSQGLLLVATDGFCNYVRREQMLKEILWIDFVVLPSKLIEMVRLPSGDIWDDVGIIACRPRRKGTNRRRYNLTSDD